MCSDGSPWVCSGHWSAESGHVNLSNKCSIFVLFSHPKNNFQKALDEIPEVHKESVFELWQDSEEAIKEKGVIPNDYLWELVNRLEDAACLDMMQPDILTREINAAKYAVQEAHSRMIDELMKSDRFQSLLPNYVTREELEAIINGKCL